MLLKNLVRCLPFNHLFRKHVVTPTQDYILGHVINKISHAIFNLSLCYFWWSPLFTFVWQTPHSHMPYATFSAKVSLRCQTKFISFPLTPLLLSSCASIMVFITVFENSFLKVCLYYSSVLLKCMQYFSHTIFHETNTVLCTLRSSIHDSWMKDSWKTFHLQWGLAVY